VLHWAGIDRSILDIAARPDFAIVDGIMGMEGNGPIQGTPKAAGVLLFGDDPVAVDATACRVMGLLPEKVDYLARAGTMHGHVETSKIQQLGKQIDAVKDAICGAAGTPKTGGMTVDACLLGFGTATALRLPAVYLRSRRCNPSWTLRVSEAISVCSGGLIRR